MSQKAKALSLPEQDHRRLKTIEQSKQVPDRVRLRARILLGAAEGLSNSELAARLSVSRPTVIQWRKHYAEHGLDVLSVPRARADRLAVLQKEMLIVNTSFCSRPRNAVGWTIHSVARHLHISRDTVEQAWRDYGITQRILWGETITMRP